MLLPRWPADADIRPGQHLSRHNFRARRICDFSPGLPYSPYRSHVDSGPARTARHSPHFRVLGRLHWICRVLISISCLPPQPARSVHRCVGGLREKLCFDGLHFQPNFGALRRHTASCVTVLAMPKSDFDTAHADRRGMLLASLCFIHCVAGPIALSYAGFSSLIGVSEKLEPLFLIGSGAMGIIAFVPAYRKKHGRRSCLALFVSGLFCLLLRRHIAFPALSVEPVVTAVGAGLIIGAHVLNLRFSKHCRCCVPSSETIGETAHTSGCATTAAPSQIQGDNIEPEVSTTAISEGKICRLIGARSHESRP